MFVNSVMLGQSVQVLDLRHLKNVRMEHTVMLLAANIVFCVLMVIGERSTHLVYFVLMLFDYSFIQWPLYMMEVINMVTLFCVMIKICLECNSIDLKVVFVICYTHS